MRNKFILFIAAISLIANTIPSPLQKTAEAYPGEREDENCELLIQQSISALQSGQQVEAPDCLNAPGLSAIEMRAINATMQNYPAPQVQQVPINNEILYQRNYRRIVGNVDFYDAPGGTVIGHIERGYNFVAIRQRIEGWVQLSNGSWVSSEYVQDADVSEFSGVQFTEPLTVPIAWMIRAARPSSYPGGPEDANLPRIPQYTLLNIYGTEIVNGWEWYLIGPNQWLQQTRVAKPKPVQRPEGIEAHEIWVAIDLFEQTLVAYEGDRLVYATLISSGLPQWSTNKGLFQVYLRAIATPMSGATGQPDFYFIESVPWVMYYDGDIALHGTYWHDAFGYRQSHGCVNLSIIDSWWVYRWGEKAPDGKFKVYVYSSGEYRADLPAWARRTR